MAITLCSYNVHGCVGRDGQFDPSRIAAVIRELGPDIIALQEVAAGAGLGHDLIELFSNVTGLLPVAGPVLWSQTGGHYGNAVLTRFEPLAVRRIDLTCPGHEPRGALDLDLDYLSLHLRLIATHLGLLPNERRKQVRRILGHLGDSKGTINVLMGDINEWFLWGRPLRWLHAHFGKGFALPTFPSAFPLLALDRIWVEPRGRVIEVKVHRSHVARIASDHLPICATLEW